MYDPEEDLAPVSSQLSKRNKSCNFEVFSTLANAVPPSCWRINNQSAEYVYVAFEFQSCSRIFLSLMHFSFEERCCYDKRQHRIKDGCNIFNPILRTCRMISEGTSCDMQCAFLMHRNLFALCCTASCSRTKSIVETIHQWSFQYCYYCSQTPSPPSISSSSCCYGCCHCWLCWMVPVVIAMLSAYAKLPSSEETSGSSFVAGYVGIGTKSALEHFEAFWGILSGFMCRLIHLIPSKSQTDRITSLHSILIARTQLVLHWAWLSRQ